MNIKLTEREILALELINNFELFTYYHSSGKLVCDQLEKRGLIKIELIKVFIELDGANITEAYSCQMTEKGKLWITLNRM